MAHLYIFIARLGWLCVRVRGQRARSLSVRFSRSNGSFLFCKTKRSKMAAPSAVFTVDFGTKSTARRRKDFRRLLLCRDLFGHELGLHRHTQSQTHIRWHM